MKQHLIPTVHFPSLNQFFAFNACSRFPFLKFLVESSYDLNLSVTRAIYLVVVQKRGSFLVCRNDRALTSEGEFLSEDTGNCDHEGGNEENTHNDEGEDPLEGDGVSEELANANGG